MTSWPNARVVPVVALGTCQTSPRAYQSIQQRLRSVARASSSIEDFVLEFNATWRHGPFSHVNLVVAQQSAEEMADYFDTMNVGGSGARLEWQGQIAVLTITTMMGLDTIDQIQAAYRELAQKTARALVVDLRENAGGAFALRPLVCHLIPVAMEVGAFVSQAWFESNTRAPSVVDVGRIAPWNGWSLKSFWNDVSRLPITRIQLRPSAPIYTGPVYVLTSQKTASAAELAVDAMGRLENVTLVGERTAGQMLSQKMFDVSYGLQIFLPIADYYSSLSGRIEGVGVAPDVGVEAGSALIVALEMVEKESVP
jgi:carboxyl-terminal processing protease